MLSSDLFISVPKNKDASKERRHRRAEEHRGNQRREGRLVHHRQGSAADGGDEFPPGASPLIRMQVRVRERLQKRSPALFRAGRLGWTVIRALAGIRTAGTRRNLNQKMYVGAGSWHGNDTVWRMIYDLNRIIRYAPPEGGRLRDTPQRALFGHP